MAYESDDIKKAQEIYYYLLKNHELSYEDEAEYYDAYMGNSEIQNLVKSQGEISGVSIDNYGTVIYFIPNEDNDFLGYSKAMLKAELCKSKAVNKDYYLSQFVIITLLTELYDGSGASSRVMEYIRFAELQNIISKHLKAGIKEDEEEENKDGIAFSAMSEAYESLKSDVDSTSKTTKEGFIKHILGFLEKQGLITYVSADGMIIPTKKLDSFMDWNLLNEKNYSRVQRVLGEIDE